MRVYSLITLSIQGDMGDSLVQGISRWCTGPWDGDHFLLEVWLSWCHSPGEETWGVHPFREWVVCFLLSLVQATMIIPLVDSASCVCRTGRAKVIPSSGWFYLLVLVRGCHLPYEQTRRCLSFQVLSGVYNVYTGPLVGWPWEFWSFLHWMLTQSLQ